MHIDSLLVGRVLAFAAMSVVLELASPALAGGGTHIVDDDATLPAGICHVESWLTLAEEADGLAVAAPAYTFAALPRLEIATAIQRTWGADEVATIAPALKLNLRSFEDAPVGAALSGAAIWNTAEGRVESFALIMPASSRINEWLVVHGNLGWIGQPGIDDRHALFWGAQAEFAIHPDLVLMGEVFGTDRGSPGGQAGLRWITDSGRIDVDLLAGHRIDGGSASSLTIGLTIRR